MEEWRKGRREGREEGRKKKGGREEGRREGRSEWREKREGMQEGERVRVRKTICGCKQIRMWLCVSCQPQLVPRTQPTSWKDGASCVPFVEEELSELVFVCTAEAAVHHSK